MIGIYKITNPKGKIYIGQSIDIEMRFYRYKRLNVSGQHKILSSLKKYGVDNHKFEVLLECESCQLNELERYFQDVFDVTNKNGLNLVLTTSKDRTGKMSDEAKKRISNTKKGKFVGNNHPFFGKTHTEESKEKMRVGNSGKIASLETRLKMSKSHMSRTPSFPIIDTNTGIIYRTQQEAAKNVKLRQQTLSRYLSGKRKNKTTLIYLKS